MVLELEGRLRQRPAPDAVAVDKGHGRLERRELWLVEAQELGRYLEQELHWPGVRACGLIRRWRRQGLLGPETEAEQVWVTSVPFAHLTPELVLGWLRHHWGIENRVFWVRDVSYGEDRLHGRKIGLGLACLRSGAINIIRRLGYRYLPDGWRSLSDSRQLLATLTTSP